MPAQQSGRTLLHYAVLADNLAVVGELISCEAPGLNLATRNPERSEGEFAWAPLSVAMAFDSVPLVEQLLNGRADPSITSLMAACQFGRLDNFTLWFTHFPSWNMAATNRFGETALSVTLTKCAAGSVMVPMVRQLLQARSDVHHVGHDGVGCVIKLAVNENIVPCEAIHLLIEARANVDLQVTPRTERFRKTFKESRDVVQRGGAVGFFQRLMASSVGTTALGTAAIFGRADLVQDLLQVRADPSLRNILGHTALEQARFCLGVVPAALEDVFLSGDTSIYAL